MKTPKTINLFMAILLFLLVYKTSYAQPLNARALGYSLMSEYKTSMLNNGIIGGAAEPGGYYRGLQYLSNCSFVLGIPGKDSQGNSYPWAVGRKWLYDRWADTYRWYGSDTSYWGPTVSESWMDRTNNFHITDWEAAKGSEQLFGEMKSYQLTPDWGNLSPVLAHSNYPLSWPLSGWPGFWGWNKNGKVTPGTFFSDEDIYFEMDDRFANRDVYPEGVLPGYPTQIKVKVMASAFADFPQDFIIFRYRLINESKYNYKNVYAGFYFDADIPKYSNTDDMLRLNRKQQTAYIWDLDGISNYGNDLAFVGITLLETPLANKAIDLDGDGMFDIYPGDQTGLTGWHYFDWYFRPGARDVNPYFGPWTGDGTTPGSADREAIQYKIMAGDTSNLSSYNRAHYFHPSYRSHKLNPYFDSTEGILDYYPNGFDAVFILSCGPFDLDAGDSTEIVMALIAAPDSLELLQYAKTARLLYKTKYPWKGLNLLSGNGGEKFSGQATVTWQRSADYSYAVKKVDIYLGKGYSSIWEPLAFNIDNNFKYTFNTENWEDGVFYKIYVFSAEDHFTYGKSADFFTIDNPGNGKPNLFVFNPQKKDILKGISYLKWLAADPENQDLTISISIQVEGRDYLIRPYISTKGLDSLKVDWNSFTSGKAILYFNLKDQKGAIRQLIVDNLYVSSNEEEKVRNIFKHKSGTGKALIEASLVDPMAIRKNTYQIYFSSGDTAQYATVAMIDTINGMIQKKIIDTNIPYINTTGITVFDGVSLNISGYLPPKIDSTFWKKGNATSQFEILSQGQGNPADYEIVFGETGIDTSMNGKAVSFHIFNKTFSPETPLDFLFFEKPPNKTELDSGDVIFLKETNLDGKIVSSPITTYRLIYSEHSTDNKPQPGDVYRFTTLRFFSERDTFEFTPATAFTSLSSNHKAIPKTPKLFQNYPNPFNATTTIKYSLSKNCRVKLEIYNVLGQKIKTLINTKQNAGNHQITFDGSHLSSGIYYFRLQTDVGFVQTRKLVLLK